MNLNYRIMTKRRMGLNCNFDRTYTVRLKGKVNTQTAEKFSEETLKSGFDRFPQELMKFLLDELSDNFDNFTVEVKVI